MSWAINRKHESSLDDESNNVSQSLEIQRPSTVATIQSLSRRRSMPSEVDQSKSAVDLTMRRKSIDPLVQELDLVLQRSATSPRLEPLQHIERPLAPKSLKLKRQNSKLDREKVLQRGMEMENLRRATLIQKLELRDAKLRRFNDRVEYQEMQKLWMTQIAIVYGADLLGTMFIRKKLQQNLKLLHLQSARRIQRWFRSIYARRYGISRLRLWALMRPIIWKIRLQRKCTMRKIHASMIRQFFRDRLRNEKITRPLTVFYEKVVRCQRYIRSYLLIQQHRKLLLSKLWDTVERAQRRHIKQAAYRAVKNCMPNDELPTTNFSADEMDEYYRNASSTLKQIVRNSHSVRTKSVLYGNQVHRSTPLDLEVISIIRRILWKFQRVLDAGSSMLYIHDKEKGELIFRVSERAGEQRAADDCGIAGYVIQNSVIVNSSNVYGDDRYEPCVDRVFGVRMTSLLCIPIQYNGHTIAACQVANKYDGKRFSASDERLLETCSAHLGIALAAIYTKKEFRNLLSPILASKWSKICPNIKALPQQLAKSEEVATEKLQLASKAIAATRISSHIKSSKSTEKWIEHIDSVNAGMKQAICVSDRQVSGLCIVLNRLSEKSKILTNILYSARQDWIHYATTSYGPVGKHNSYIAELGIEDAKKLLHATLQPSESAAYFAPVCLKWPSFLLLQQDIVSPIMRHLFDIETKRVRNEGLATIIDNE